MDFLDNARNWYANATKDLNKVFVSVYPTPGGKGQALMYMDGEPNEVWHEVEHVIRTTMNRYSRFNIRLARNTKNDPTPVNYPIDVPWNANQLGGLTSSISGVPSGGTVGDIGAIKKEMEANFEERLRNYKEQFELTSRVAGLEDELRRKKRRSGDFFEKIEGFAETTGLDLSNPESIKAISGLVMGAMDKVIGAFRGVPVAVPSVGSTPVTGKTRIIEEEEEEQIQSESEEDVIDFTGIIKEELIANGVSQEEIDNLDFNEAIEAMMIIQRAGAPNAGQILLKVAKFYQKDPEKAENLIKSFLK